MSTATELLREALESLEEMDASLESEFGTPFSMWRSPLIIKDIRAFLTAESEAEPFGRLEADLSPPSGKGPFTNVDDLMKALREDDEKKAEPVACVNTPLSMVYPEYNRRVLGARPEPAIREPMTEEEIKMALLIRGFPYDAFRAGVRFAEKHHGIGGDDGNHK